MDMSEITEWRIAAYRCFHESPNCDSAQNQSNTVCTHHIDEEVLQTGTKEFDNSGVWRTRKDHTAANLVLRLSKFAHLVLMQGSEIVESYFLILAKKWIKAINIDEEIMLMIRKREQVRRIRLTFYSQVEAVTCYQQLAIYVSVKHLPPAETPLNEGSLNEEAVRQWLHSMTSSPVMNPMTSAAWGTEWPTETLGGLVKLCLLDPNFPGFVAQVQESIRHITNVHHSEFDSGLLNPED